MPPYRIATFGLAIAIVAVGVAGAATAVTASGGNPVHTCVSKSTGIIRVATTCGPSERSLDLGQASSPGRTAAKGTTPPSTVYVRRLVGAKPSVTVRIPANRQIRPLKPIKVPAGKYVVNLTGEFNSGSESGADLYCSITFVGKKTVSFGLGLGVLMTVADQYQSASEQDVVTLKTPTKISPYCGTTDGNTHGTAGIYSADLTALTVGAVHKFS